MLDCQFCGLTYFDFNSLAYHVKYQCLANPSRQGQPSPRKDQSPMATPRPPARRQQANTDKGTTRPPARGSVPDPNASGTANLDFLKAEHIGGHGESVIILFHGKPARSFRNDYGEQLIFLVTLDDKNYALGVNVGSRNHQFIYDKFQGRNPDGEVTATVDTSRNGRPFVALS